MPNVIADVIPNDQFRKAFVRIKHERRLYGETTNGVTFLTPTLYRASIFVPAEALVGNYDVDVKLFADGAVIARTSSKPGCVEASLPVSGSSSEISKLRSKASQSAGQSCPAGGGFCAHEANGTQVLLKSALRLALSNGPAEKSTSATIC